MLQYVSFHIFIFCVLFLHTVTLNKCTRIIHRLLISFQIWSHFIYISFDANHMKNGQSVAFHTQKNKVTYFGKNINYILLNTLKRDSELHHWLIFGFISHCMALLLSFFTYLKDTTGKQVFHSLMHGWRWYWSRALDASGDCRIHVFRDVELAGPHRVCVVLVMVTKSCSVRPPAVAPLAVVEPK